MNKFPIFKKNQVKLIGTFFLTLKNTLRFSLFEKEMESLFKKNYISQDCKNSYFNYKRQLFLMMSKRIYYPFQQCAYKDVTALNQK